MFCSKRCVNPSTIFWMRKEQLTISTPSFNFTKNSPEENHYTKLGLKPNATKDEIKQAYYQKCKDLHPDRNPSKEAMTGYKDVQDAYEILSNKSKRQEYDRSLQTRIPDPGFQNQKIKYQGTTGARKNIKRHPFHTENQFHENFRRTSHEPPKDFKFENPWTRLTKRANNDPGDDYHRYTYRNFKDPGNPDPNDPFDIPGFKSSKKSQEPPKDYMKDFHNYESPWIRHCKKANDDPQFDKFENFLWGEPNGIFTRVGKFAVSGIPVWKFICVMYIFIFLSNQILSLTLYESAEDVNVVTNDDKPK